MKQAGRPKPRPPCIYIYGKLNVLYEGAAGFEAARCHVLVGAGGVEIKKESMPGKICASTSPITSQLCAMPEVPDVSTRHSENRSVV